MVESDDEYVQELSDEDVGAHQVTRGPANRVGRGRKRSPGGGDWDVKRTWEDVEEGADGTINSAIEGLLEAGKRKR